VTPDARLPYSRALAGWDTEGIFEQLRDDAVIRVAVHDAPLQGRDIAAFLFGVLAEELGRPEITDEIVEGRRAVVLFETTIGGRQAQGLNVLELDADGRIGALTVFFRPLDALARIAQVVGARMEARFGPPPE